MTRTFKIHESNKATAEKNLEALNKKFAKHNVPLITYSWSEKDEVDCMDLTVDCPDVPTISGVDYKYLGFISYEDGSKIYNGFENTDKFKTIRMMDCTCDMCKKQITNRTSFFVFEAKDEIKMFGSSCAKKAFPFDIGWYLNGLENLFDDIETMVETYDDMGCFGGKKYYDIDRMISALAEITDDFTVWVSQEKAEMDRPTMSTKEKVLDLLTKKN